MTNPESFPKADGRTRRDAAKMLAAQCLGLSFVSNLPAAATLPGMGGGKAKSLIIVNFAGGISHVDTFDIKEGNQEANSRSQPIKTNADGIRIGKYFSRMADHMDRVAVINSMQHALGIHGDASYLMQTAYERRSTITHPEIGAWMSKHCEHRSGDIPPFIKMGAKSGLGAGFFPGKYGALPIPDPSKGVSNSALPRGVAEDRFENRFSLTESLNQEFNRTLSTGLTENYHEAYANAVKLMSSEDLVVFDLNQESDKTKETYGKNHFGYGCLLARRLVERGVGCVTIGHGGWDDHGNIYDEFESRSDVADRGISALLSDLRSHGLLDSTIVAITTEFGRDSKINRMGGRGHNPRGYTCMLAGGGIQGGQKYGATDPMGQTAVENIVSPADFHATIAHALGLSTEVVEMSATGRPFTLANKGKPVTALF
ncbi:MAG: DUF1501 domain-containing protein [Verrucomicrobiota bacterium]